MTFWRRKCKQTTSRREAEQALEREKRAREDVDSQALEIEAKRPLVDKLAESLASHRERNHFADLVRRSLS